MKKRIEEEALERRVSYRPSLTIEKAEQALAATVEYCATEFDAQPFTAISSDSREVMPGGIFVAVSGTNMDGWKFLGKALEAGARLVISSHNTNEKERALFDHYGAAHIKVEDTRLATAMLAGAFYNFPAKSLQIIAVTGTNGKTTTATLLYRLFTSLGFRCGLIGTVENRISHTVAPSSLTTPDPIALQQLMRQMVDADCQYLFMEVSSHALEQHRVEGLQFSGALFTNLTRDHLDYHGDMLHYQRAKKKLFDGLEATAFALINADEKHSDFMVQNCSAKTYTYALQTKATFSARIVEKDLEGTELLLNGKSVWVRLTGIFNIYNVLAVWGAANLLLPHYNKEKLLCALSRLNHAPGRFEVLRSQQCTAIVDYAHTPDALSKVLSTIAEIISAEGRIITVVGAGGERDKGKRPLMAREAFSGSDLLLLTSDNPRREEPQDIIDDMLAGFTAEERRKVLSIVDRREAIRTAITIANPADVVLVAGKGHEDYQEINGVRRHFDDREVIREVLNLPTAQPFQE